MILSDAAAWPRTGQIGGCQMKKTRELVFIALSAAFIAVCAWITIPGPIPFTMQTLAVLTVAALLGAGKGIAAVGVYLLLGAVGAPVFSGFRAGVQALVGPTGGYLIGFLFTALLTGLIAGKSDRAMVIAAGMAAGAVVYYVFGTAWYALFFANGGVREILMTCVVPFLIPDALKIALSVLLVRRIRKSGVLK